MYIHLNLYDGNTKFQLFIDYTNNSNSNSKKKTNYSLNTYEYIRKILYFVN